MEYLQCTHCKKKYGVNDKVRAFVGAPYKCKTCGEKFVLTIYDTQDPRLQAKKDAAGKEDHLEKEPNKAKSAIQKPSVEKTEEVEEEQEEAIENPPEKRKNIQQYISVTLGVFLLIGVAFILFMENKPDIPTGIQQTESTVLQGKQAPKEQFEQVQAKPEERSLECKKEAARQWLIDVKMIHNTGTNEDYLNLIDQSQTQSEKFRAVCTDVKDVQKVLQAATNKKPLPWFKDQIKSVEYESFDLPIF